MTRSRFGILIGMSGALSAGLAAIACLAAEARGGGTQTSAKTEPRAQTDAPTADSSKEVILHIGDQMVITQADFNRAMHRATLQDYTGFADRVIYSMIDDRLLDLYLTENPGLVSEVAVDDMVAQNLKQSRLASVRDLEDKFLRPNDVTISDFRRDQRRILGRTALTRRGMDIAKDDAKLQAIFNADPSAYDGTRVEVRQVAIATLPYDTPEQRAAKRQKLVKIREDLVAGRMTWENCVKQSDDRVHGRDGYLGFLPRHMEYLEPVMAAAFKAQPGTTSEIVESPLAFHLLNVGRRQEGGELFGQAQPMMKIWMEKQQYSDMLDEMRRKHPIVGVRAPAPPPHLKALVEAAASRPAGSQPSGTSPR